MLNDPDLLKHPDCRDEINSIHQPGLKSDVEKHLKKLEDEPNRVIHGELDLGLGSYKYKHEHEEITIRYTKTNHGSDQYRVYFKVIGDFIVCLKGWEKSDWELPERIKTQVHNRLIEVQKNPRILVN